jgi:hypothetical protein
MRLQMDRWLQRLGRVIAQRDTPRARTARTPARQPNDRAADPFRR